MLFKKEVLVTKDINLFYSTQQKLKTYNIPYQIKNSHSKSRFSVNRMYPIHKNYKPIYYIYVSHKYFDQAVYIINKK